VYFRAMKRLVFLVFYFVLSQSIVAQSTTMVPKKMCGTYLGIQPAYLVLQHNQSIQIDSVKMEIEVSRNEISICYKIPEFCPVLNGRIAVINKLGKGRRKTWTVQVTSTNSMIFEELVFNQKRKVLTRKGVFPQPDTQLIKSRKKQ